MEQTSSSSFADRALMAVIAAVIVYAVGLVVAGLFLGDQVFDRLGFGPDDGGITADAGRDYLRLVFGILGAVIVGWMITVGAIVAGPLRRREPWAWTAVVAAVSVWFVLDTGLSLLLGFVGHALFNVAFAAAITLPLVSIRGDVHAASR